MLSVTIIGMGLIGTSLGMAIRSASEDTATLGPTAVTGYDENPKATAEARGRLAIDRQARTLDEAVRDADLVVVAVPALAARTVLSQLAPLLRHGAVVTDVVSTKQEIMAWARDLLPATVSFVGGHPMAGSEQSGAQAAASDLLQGATYCITTDVNTKPEAIELVDAMVRQVKAKPYYIDAVEHDSFVAAVSHLPFLLSTALIGVTTNSPSWREMAPLAATGYRDITRLASGDVTMHRDISLTNSVAMIRWIDETQDWLANMRALLAERDSDALQDLFAAAHAGRAAWLETRPNVRPGESDFNNISDVVPERRSLFGFGGQRKQDRKR